MGEFLRSPRILALSVALGLGSIACDRQDTKESQEAAICTSPRLPSHTYTGDPEADPEDQSTWKTGIEVETAVPDDAKGVIVGFSSPVRPDWSDSEPVSPDKADSIALRIGDDSVDFSVQIQAPAGSPACDTKPDAKFGEVQEFEAIVQQGAVKPEWPED